MKRTGERGARGQRWTRAIATGAALLAAIGPATAADKLWIDTSDNWGDNLNWSPWGIPVFGDNAIIGGLNSTHDYTVTLDGVFGVSGVQLSNGMRLATSNGKLIVQGETVVSGVTTTGTTDTQLWVHNGANAIDFDTDELHAEDGGRVRLLGGSVLEVDQRATIDSDSRLWGEGTVTLHGANESLQNDGTISASAGTLTFDVAGGGDLDLDGASGNGRLLATSWGAGPVFPHLEFNGGQMADTFNGEIQIVGNGSIAMNLDVPWTAGGSSLIYFSGLASNPGPAELSGADLSITGEVLVGMDDHGRITANTTFNSGADVHLNSEALLEMDGEAEINDGVYTMAEGARLRFDGPTTLSGGVFNTVSADPGDGYVRFAGETTWAGGTVTVNGVAQQNGDASVSGTTTIQGDLFDMDGSSGNTEWSLARQLTLNVGAIDDGNNKFDGVINAGGLYGRLNVNLSDPADSWRMDGEMNLSGFGGFVTTRVQGSAMEVTGVMNISNGVAIAADTEFGGASEVNFQGGFGRLRMAGATRVDGAATFNGAGEFENGPTGQMVLEDGLTLGSSDLRNRGLLELGDQAAALVAVNEFANMADGTWLVDLGGSAAGSEHDLLVAGGVADLAGELEVSLIDAGGGFFVPEVGDAFTVLTAFGGVNGAFANAPTTEIGGQVFNWDVQHNANNVTLELIDLTGLAGDYNYDGVVDAGDYSVWRDAMDGDQDLAADGNLDGVVNEADHTVWAANYGATLGGGAIAFLSAPAAVPEPSGVVLAFGLVAIAWRGASRR